METLSESKNSTSGMGFLKHIFNFDSDSKSDMLNISQYSLLAILPVVILNKIMLKFVPEADEEKGSIELLAEIIIQILIMFLGIFFIDRIITYIPTYSGFKYENLTLTNVILAFLIIVLSIQTKLGIKVNILVDRIAELWNGPSQSKQGKGSGNRGGSNHTISQSDYIDNSPMQGDMYPPAPMVTSKPSGGGGYDQMRGASSGGAAQMSDYSGPMAANSVLGGSFGSFF